MSNESQIERIRNNVADALAATAEMGASVPATANSNNLGALIRSIPKSGGASIDVTAEVGQTIVVKEVDENGKPTAWEAAEYQPRTHWSELGIAELLPETTIATDPEGGMVPYSQTIGLIVGGNYTVKWNGTEYNCIAQEYREFDEGEGVMVSVGVVVGNVDIMMGGEGTGEPFIIIEFSPEFAVEFGASAVIMAIDGSESVVLSIVGVDEIVHPVPSKYVSHTLPYYLDVTGDGTEDNPFVCKNTVEEVLNAAKSGRSLVMRRLGIVEGIVWHVDFFQCYYVRYAGDVAGAMQFGNYGILGYQVFIFEPQDDGTYVVLLRND